MNLNSARKWQGALALCLAAALPYVATAQNTPSDQPAPAETGTKEVQMEKFIVTGSNIPTTLTATEAGTYPLVTLSRVDIDQTGYANAAALLQKLTISNQGAVAISNNGTGFTPAATSVSLRGLGSEATLVLINGHRVAPYPVGVNGDTAFVDLNTIPLGMIENIEVLKDGASAVYGADAVAGVVNIILRKNYNGSEATVSYQNTTNKDSGQFTANLLSGVSNDRGSITVGFNYQTRNAIYNRDRSYSQVPAFLSSNSSPINAEIGALAFDEATGAAPGTLPTGASGNVFFGTPGPVTADGLPTSSSNNGHVPASQWVYADGRPSHYNYNQDSSSFPSWTRYGMIFNGERKMFNSDNVKAYFDGNYQLSTTENQLAPAATGNFATPGQTTLVIPARTPNPILSVVDGETGNLIQVAAGTPLPSGDSPGPGTTVDSSGNVQRVAAPGAYNPNNPFNQDITDGTRFRTKEFGNRIFHDTNEAFMGTAGIRGDNIAGLFNFDAGIRYSEVTFRGNDTLVSSSKFNDVLNANSTLLQNAGLAPYNPFGYYANPIPANMAVTSLATVHVHDVDTSSIGNAFITVNTTSLFELPGGAVGAAAGLDYRVESLKQSPDSENATGDIIGSSPGIVTDHSRKVAAIFAEIQLPITSPSEKIPGLYSMSVDLAGRYEDFLTNHDHTAVPKIGLRYQPFNDTLTIRASASRGFLEPSLFKLYAGNISGLQTLTDPRTQATLQETPAVTSGNSRLKAEKSKAYNVGVVWSPKTTFMRNFTANVDLWRIERDGTALYDFQDTLNRWGAAGATGSAGLLPGEAVILDPAGNISEVITSYHNAGRTIADGADIGASYFIATSDIGRFDFAAGMSYLHSFKQASTPGGALQQLVDTTQDGEGQDAYLRRKARIDATWTYAHWKANIAANFIDSFQNFDIDGNPVRTGSSWTFDARVSYTLHGEAGEYLQDTTISVGAINVLDRHPPLSQYYGANPDNYPGFIYTSEDRMLYVSLTKRF